MKPPTTGTAGSTSAYDGKNCDTPEGRKKLAKVYRSARIQMPSRKKKLMGEREGRKEITRKFALIRKTL